PVSASETQIAPSRATATPHGLTRFGSVCWAGVAPSETRSVWVNAGSVAERSCRDSSGSNIEAARAADVEGGAVVELTVVSPCWLGWYASERLAAHEGSSLRARAECRAACVPNGNDSTGAAGDRGRDCTDCSGPMARGVGN